MDKMIPYGRQSIDEKDIEAVVEVLRSDWLTTGPKVMEFEKKISEFVGAKEAVAVCNGTAALHAAMHALNIGPGDEVIVPAMTFAATANCIVFQGGTPVFADVNSDTLLISLQKLEEKISSQTKAVIAVDFAGHPCDYEKLWQITEAHNLFLIADSCHALGATYNDKKVGSLADLTAFSFHPVKHITTGEGGVITTTNTDFARRMRAFRNHGIDSDLHQRSKRGTWYYEMMDLGYNYRLTDFQCALGISQMEKLMSWIASRGQIAKKYDSAFDGIEEIESLKVGHNVGHAYHLYVIKLNLNLLTVDRKRIFSELRNNRVGVNVHYFPVHLHPFYQQRFNTGYGLCPIAEKVYEEILSLPIYPQMTDDQVDYVIETVLNLVAEYAR